MRANHLPGKRKRPMWVWHAFWFIVFLAIAFFLFTQLDFAGVRDRQEKPAPASTSD